MSKWQALQNDINEWQGEQFGRGSDPVPTLHHLREEVPELIKAWESNDPEVIMEFADCLMLIIGAAGRANIDMQVLQRAVYTKLEINKRREWGTPDENGVVKHI